MSRVGKMPITVPQGVDVQISADQITVKGANGIIMGSYTKNLAVNAPIDAEYRVVVAGTSVVSNWAPLYADC